MLIREVRSDEKEIYNRAAAHPLQSWEWGDFRQATGVDVVRLASFEGSNIKNSYTITFHPVPKTSFTIGYLPKSSLPEPELFEAIKRIGQQKNCIFVKLEPDIKKEIKDAKLPEFKKEEDFLSQNNCLPGRPMFTRYNFLLDLTKSEEELLSCLKSKTRYNTKLAAKKGVKIIHDNSDGAFADYLKLTAETTKRQKFYAHSENYHQLMWNTLKPSGMAELLLAKYQQVTLAAWVLFNFHHTLYYPYGSSSSENRELMASNLLMWEAIRFGQKLGCKTFDLWGCLGTNPDPKDPWFGFHRFKQGYTPIHVQTIGSWDYILNLPAYKLYVVADKLRWKWLRLKALLP